MSTVGMNRPRVVYNVSKIAAEMTRRGWNDSDLAREAKVSAMTIGRFLSGRVQTAKTAKAIADAFGHKVDRYIVAPEAKAGSEAVA